MQAAPASTAAFAEMPPASERPAHSDASASIHMDAAQRDSQNEMRATSIDLAVRESDRIDVILGGGCSLIASRQ